MILNIGMVISLIIYYSWYLHFIGLINSTVSNDKVWQAQVYHPNCLHTVAAVQEESSIHMLSVLDWPPNEVV